MGGSNLMQAHSNYLICMIVFYSNKYGNEGYEIILPPLLELAAIAS